MAIAKKDWIANFNLVGTPKINDYTFKMDEKSQNSSWIYNALNLGIDCGEKHGVVYAEMMGGYSSEKQSVIYAHGKKEDGSDDFDARIEVAWEDRENEEILEKIGDLCFISVGIEKTDKGKTFTKKFLSEYDAIAYVKEHITEDMVLNVRGNLKYSDYQDKTQMRKNITSIFLSKVDDPSKYFAHFTQSILIDSESASLKNIDKDKGVMFVDAVVLDYLKEKDGVEIKGQYPFRKQFEFAMDFSNQAQCKTIVEKLFKVKKGWTQVTFEGDFIEGGAITTITVDDIPDDIKELIGVVFTEEEALARCSSNGSREKRMVLKKPYIKMVGDDKEKVPVVQKFEERYEDDELFADIVKADDVPFEVDDNENTTPSDAADMDWLNNL